MKLSNLNEIKACDSVIIAVAHKQYKKLSADDYSAMLTTDGVLFDIKGILSREALAELDVTVLRI